MSWIFIEAEDVWFFRDTHSFGRGEDHLARCLFPPFPATIAGAIRSRIVGEHPGWDQTQFNAGADAGLYARIGKPGDLGPNFRIRGPFLARRVNQRIECFAPLPADCYFENEQESRFGCFQPKKNPGLLVNWPNDGMFPLWPPQGKRKDSVNNDYWISRNSFRSYQNGNFCTAENAQSFFDLETRIGNARDYNSGSVKEQMLYSASFVRMQDDTGLLVWVADNVNLPASGLLALGGESRAARYTTIADDLVRLMPGIETKGETRLKLVFQTPAYFKNGWQPEDGDWGRFGLPTGAHLKAAALGRPLTVNGWDIAKGQQKTLRSFVPAGSVYHFEWDQPIHTSLDFQHVHLTESPVSENYPQLGLGQVMPALWNWQA